MSCNDWKEVKLGEVCEKIGSGATPTGGKSAYKKAGISLIRSQNVLDFSFSYDGLAFIDTIQAKKLNIVEVKASDVLLNITGDSVARTCLVPTEALPARVNQHVSILRSHNERLNPNFLHYTLENSKEKLLIMASGGATRNALTKQMLENFAISLPPLPEQKAIADTLSCLDDKIELNNKINKNLEAQAQAIFKSWFVDFEPWGGVMPEDWIVGTLRDICNYSDKRIKKTAFDIYNYVSTENMLAEKQGIVNASSLPNVDSATCFEVGNTLISNIRPYFKKIYYCDFRGACSTDVLCFVPKSENLQEYVFFALFSDSFFEYVMSGSKGTKMPRGDKSQIMQYKVCFSEAQLILFSKAAKPLLDVISLNRKQTQALTALRDTLLPKLMSGELRVPPSQSIRD